MRKIFRTVMKNPSFCIVSTTVPAVDETVFVWASENKCFLTSLASVLTAAADEVVSLLFVSHSVCPENIKIFLWLKNFSWNIFFSSYLSQIYWESLKKHNFRPLANWTWPKIEKYFMIWRQDILIFKLSYLFKIAVEIFSQFKFFARVEGFVLYEQCELLKFEIPLALSACQSVPANKRRI